MSEIETTPPSPLDVFLPKKPIIFPPLTHTDRSDVYAEGTPPQALVRVVKGSQDMLFDGHSFAQHEAALLGQGWTVYEDIRFTTNSK